MADSVPDMAPQYLAAPPQLPLKAGSPDSGHLIAAPANIILVTSAEQLQKATLAQAEDIEIRAHLDLHALSLAENPDIGGPESENNRKRLALLYARRRLRSLRVRNTKS